VTERDEPSKEHEAPTEPKPEEPTPKLAPPIDGSMGSPTSEAAANRQTSKKPWWQFWK
jgi:hypothetical protein